MLFEVTGLRLDETEFREQDSSEESEEGEQEKVRKSLRKTNSLNLEEFDQLITDLVGDDAINDGEDRNSSPPNESTIN